MYDPPAAGERQIEAIGESVSAAGGGATVRTKHSASGVGAQAKHNSMPAHIVWFKRDLAIRDHRPLVQATACARESGAAVNCLYAFEPDQLIHDLGNTPGPQWVVCSNHGWTGIRIIQNQSWITVRHIAWLGKLCLPCRSEPAAAPSRIESISSTGLENDQTSISTPADPRTGEWVESISELSTIGPKYSSLSHIKPQRPVQNRNHGVTPAQRPRIHDAAEIKMPDSRMFSL